MENGRYPSEDDAIKAINAAVKRMVCDYIDANGNTMGRVEVSFSEGCTMLFLAPDYGERRSLYWLWDELPDGTWKVTMNENA